MTKQGNFNDYLTEQGRGVFDHIRKHCQALGIWKDEFSVEAGMLSNSFAMYMDAALSCNREGGAFQEVGPNHYKQVSVHYTIMKNEYQNILKHSSKFGLNPGDLKKVFSLGADAGKKAGFTTDKPMKVA